MSQYCYIGGKIVPVGEACVSVNDIGLLRAYGISEVFRTYNKKPFLIERHWKRLSDSAKFLDIEIPVSFEEYKNIISELIAKSPYAEFVMRTILTGGQTVEGINYDKSKPTFFVIAEEFKPLDKNYYTDGAKLITYEHQRPFPEIKTIGYTTAVRLQKVKKEAGALEILYKSNGKILEASTSNFFIFKGNTLVTSNHNVLYGVTRAVALEVARENFAVEERDISVSELSEADEAFITATNKKIVPVVSIDGVKVGSGQVGSNTKKMMELFDAFVTKQIG